MLERESTQLLRYAFCFGNHFSFCNSLFICNSHSIGVIFEFRNESATAARKQPDEFPCFVDAAETVLADLAVAVSAVSGARPIVSQGIVDRSDIRLDVVRGTDDETPAGAKHGKPVANLCHNIF